MRDYLFGAFTSDKLKMIRARGLRHRAHIAPRAPLPDELVVITVTVGSGLSVENLVC